ncbi:type II secretion system minor pseudopilin GspK [Brachymonas denitrificans]|uniref:type II secretion system minor pseudopilin GspK n=1 Tax=Brachymonas denitrificans TaxID=28220 RepID=UPI00352FBDD2
MRRRILTRQRMPRAASDPRRQRGAALLLAMLTVTLVAAFAAAAVWQQWRSTEIETAERARLQSGWILAGALDWSRLILQEDARQGGPDHLSEPWAVPLMEARLSTFLAAERNITVDASNLPDDAFLSGQIEDAQGRFNLRNLLRNGQPSEVDRQTLQRLFVNLRLPATQAEALVTQWLRVARAEQQGPGSDPGAPLLPARLQQLAWLGVAPELIRQLAPHITILPERTSINANTASVEVLSAAAPNVAPGDVARAVAQRASKPFLDTAALQAVIPAGEGQAELGVNSKYFVIRGSLRLGNIRIDEQALVERQGLRSVMLWREKGSVFSPEQ